MTNRIKPAVPVLWIHLTKNGPATIANEGMFYFLEYLECKLFRFNLDFAIKFERSPNIPEVTQNNSDRIQEICSLLEHLYPKVYTSVARQVKADFRNEVIVYDVFRVFSHALFKTGVTWPRILALFCFSAAVIIDCIKEKRAEFVDTVVYFIKTYIEDILSSWIINNGGWGNLVEHFHKTRKISKWYDVIMERLWPILNFLSLKS